MMKRNPILIFAFTAVLLLLGSCTEKEETKLSCEIEKTGTITISNSSSNPYDIYVDGVLKTRIPGKSISGKLTLAEGNARALYAEQVSGYIFYPTTRNGSFNVLRCSDYTWQIP